VSQRWSVKDFDHHSPRYLNDADALFREMRETNPIGWSEQHGGFWVVTRYEDAWNVLTDTETFSSDFDLDGERNGGGGIFIPTRGPGGFGAAADHTTSGRLIPLEVDPPDTQTKRRVVMRFLAPDAVRGLEDKFRQIVTSLIDNHIESGRLDMCNDLAIPAPTLLTLNMFRAPLTNWQRWASPLHGLNGAETEGTPGHEAAQHGMAAIGRELQELIAERRANPGDDILSAIVHATVDGVPFSDEEAQEFALTVLAGGVETTTSLLLHTFAWLDQHDEDRKRLIADFSLLPSACEEFLRLSTPNQTVARTVTRDVVVAGKQMKAGDRVLVCRSSANRDEAVFPRPYECELDRFPNRHMSFGMGAHRCLGSTLARMEFRVAMEEVLTRVPDFKIDWEGTRRFPDVGVMDGYVTMAASFTPGPRVGSVVLAS
jgi:cytochrome P450